MTTPSLPGSSNSAPVGHTRQLLDELDSLMQRMLALPVEQEGASGPAGPGPEAGPSLSQAAVVPGRASVPAPARPAVLEMSRPAATEPPPRPTPVRVSPRQAAPPARQEVVSAPDSAPSQPQEEIEPQSPGPVVLGPEVFATLKAGPAPRAPRPALPRPTVPRPERRALAWLFVPLAWTNRAFDRGTEWLGTPGRWLRSSGGRTVLGWLGLGLLAAALGWQILAWVGWRW
jgi:hypothetical protein